MTLRYLVREEDHERFARSRWFVFDAQSGLDVSGPRLSLESAEAECDRLNGKIARLDAERNAS